MAEEAYEDEAYFNYHVPIPISLRRQFDSASMMGRYQMAEHLAEELGLMNGADLSRVVVRFLVVVMDSLAGVVRDPRPTIDNRGVAMADEVAKEFTVDDCLEICEYFGLAERRLVNGTTVGGVRATVRAMLGDHVGEKINKALTRWGKFGWLGMAARS